MKKLLLISMISMLIIGAALVTFFSLKSSFYSKDSGQLIEEIEFRSERSEGEELTTPEASESNGDSIDGSPTPYTHSGFPPNHDPNAPYANDMTDRVCIIGLNCGLYTADSPAPNPTLKSCISIPQEVFDNYTVSIVAVADENSLVDYWRVNGSVIESESSEITIEITQYTIIEAVLTSSTSNVRSINATMQMLYATGTPLNEKFTGCAIGTDEESGQIVPVSLYIVAEVPYGYEFDYWLINNIPVRTKPSSDVIIVENLTESAVFEAVLKKTPEQQTSVPVITPAPQPSTPAPDMVNIICINAKFSGGPYKSATSGSVPAGTQITVTGLEDKNEFPIWIINGAIYTLPDPYGKVFTCVVGLDTTFEYSGYK